MTASNVKLKQSLLPAKPAPRAKLLLALSAVLTVAANAQSKSPSACTISYKKFFGPLGIGRRLFGKILGEIGSSCSKNGLPDVTVLVVNAKLLKPGKAFLVHTPNVAAELQAVMNFSGWAQQHQAIASNL